MSISDEEKVAGILNLIREVFPKTTVRTRGSPNTITEIIFYEGINHTSLYENSLDKLTEKQAANHICKEFINMMFRD